MEKHKNGNQMCFSYPSTIPFANFRQLLSFWNAQVETRINSPRKQHVCSVLGIPLAKEFSTESQLVQSMHAVDNEANTHQRPFAATCHMTSASRRPAPAESPAAPPVAVLAAPAQLICDVKGTPKSNTPLNSSFQLI